MVGTLLGIGLAVVRDHFDDLVRDEDDAKRAAPMLPVLGRIPTGSADQRLVTLVDGASPSAEAYRGLSASVRFLLAANQTSGLTSGTGAAGGQVVLITSPDAGDGKTSTAANLSVAAARAGLRVVLVGTDMRRPKLHRRFGMPAGAGLSDVLAAEVPIREALLDVGVEGMWVLPAGTKPPNPAELLASPRMRELLDYLRGGSDLVVLDAPPVLAVADSLEMARHVDATLVVVRANQSRRRNLQHALERLEGVGAAVSGIVVNDLNAKSAAYTYYTQSYADEEPVVDRDADAAQRRGIRVRGLDESAANGQGPGAGSALKLDDPDELFPLGHERV